MTNVTAIRIINYNDSYKLEFNWSELHWREYYKDLANLLNVRHVSKKTFIDEWLPILLVTIGESMVSSLLIHQSYDGIFCEEKIIIDIILKYGYDSVIFTS